MKKLLLISILFIGCGSHSSNSNNDINSQLQQKLNTYLSLTPSTGDKYGFLGDTCDSLLWTSLYDSTGGQVDITQAQIQPGEWKRNPGTTCNSISRDMILGLLHYIWHTRNLNMIEALIDYGESHGFAMNAQSESDGANIMTPDIIATFYEMRYRLGGPDSIARAFAQSLWVGGQTGYLAHLQVLHIFLRGMMINSVTNNELNLLSNHASTNPDNALFQAVYHRFSDGDQSTATGTLLLNTYFPDTSLPTSNNYCAYPYLYQRDEYTSDWQSCADDDIIRPGVDFEFASGVVLGVVK